MYIFVYNENPRNANIVDPRDYEHMQSPSRCMTSMVQIDRSGKMTKKPILENTNKKEFTYLEPEYSLPLNNTSYIIFSSDAKISKIGRLKFSE